MKNLKKLIVALSIFLVITIIVIIVLLNSIEDDEIITDAGGAIEEEVVTNIDPVNDIYTYLDVNKTVENLFEYILNINSEGNNAEAILSILDKEYINKNSLTEDNVQTFFGKYKNVKSYFTKEIYNQEIRHLQNIEGYCLYVKGIIRQNSIEEYIYIVIKEDHTTGAYSINIMDENSFELAKRESNIKINIEKNEYNEIINRYINDSQKCYEFFNDYINTIKNNPAEGYKLLDEQYKNARFGSIENYINFINSKQSNTKDLILTQYDIDLKEEYEQYLCIDHEGNYYIFRRTDFMNYTVLLDTYTIELPEFIEKYDGATNEQKLQLNITKIIDAINNKDYQYVYNKLDENYKNNKFNNLASFEKYIKACFFEINKINSASYRQEADVYIFTLGIGNKVDENSGTRMVKILVRLLENRDFEISISI